MTTEAIEAPLVLLTTNDPEQCLQALQLLLPSLPAGGEGFALAVSCYGPRAAECEAVALKVRSSIGRLLLMTVGSVLSDGGGNQAEAVNAALSYTAEAITPAMVFVINDDVRVCPGWMQELVACLSPSEVHGMGHRVLDGYDKIGAVAPCTDQTSNRAQRINLLEGESNMGLGQYAEARLRHFTGKASAAEFLDGFCVMLTPELVEECAPLKHELGEWAWADFWLRARDAGYRLAVGEGAYVGRTTHVPLGDHNVGDIKTRLAFYAAHPVTGPVNLVATVVAPVGGWRQLLLLRACLTRAAELVDGVALLIGGNPMDAFDDPEFKREFDAKQVNKLDHRLLVDCNGQRASGVAAAVERWATAVMGGKAHVDAESWHGDAETLPQRNRVLRMAEESGATAILSLEYDEVLEPRVDRRLLARLLNHPNPLVSSWDFGILNHWDSPTLVREDSGYGHGGSYTGGPHAVRLQRLRGGRAGTILGGVAPPALPDVGPTCQRVAAVSVRRFRSVRPGDREPTTAMSVPASEGMRVSQYTGDNRMGLHCLVYEGEDPEDIARWLDHVHGLVDHIVLVWTGKWESKGWTDGEWPSEWPGDGPGLALAAVARLHGCEWAHQPLEQNFAKARNAGIDALAKHQELRWAWFIDPDEWMKDYLADGIALRNMAMSTRWGWLMQVVNYRTDRATPTISDSVRISRLDPGGIMRMDGRLHEGFSKAIHVLQARDEHPRLVYAPFMIQQRGMALGAEAMDAKLTKYEAILRLELEDNPHNPGAWVSLGWHYYNDGHDALGLECYHRAAKCAGNSYLPFKELAYHHLRIAREMVHLCDDRLVDSHQFAGLCKNMVRWLDEYAPPHPIIERMEDKEPQPLPEWTAPDTLGRSGYDGA